MVKLDEILKGAGKSRTQQVEDGSKVQEAMVRASKNKFIDIGAENAPKEADPVAKTELQQASKEADPSSTGEVDGKREKEIRKRKRDDKAPEGDSLSLDVSISMEELHEIREILSKKKGRPRRSLPDVPEPVRKFKDDYKQFKDDLHNGSAVNIDIAFKTRCLLSHFCRSYGITQKAAATYIIQKFLEDNFPEFVSKN